VRDWRHFGSRVVLVKANFADLRQVLEALHIEKVDGVLLDLGVSSHQLDTAREDSVSVSQRRWICEWIRI